MSLADLARDVKDMVMAQLPWLSLLGRFRFRVTKHTSGRLDCEPVNATWIKPFPLADAWCGIPGCRVQPAIGDEIIIEFLDRIESQPIVTGFAPLSAFKPVRVEIDASGHVDLGEASSGAGKAVHRVDDKGTAGTVRVTPSDAAGTGLLFTNADGSTYSVPITFTGGAVVVGPAVPPGPFTLVTKATTGAARVRA